MFDFFDSFFDFIKTVVDFIVGLVANIVMVVRLIAEGFVAFGLVVDYLPSLVKTVALAIVAYCVVVNVLNKGG